jgi:hypothetical protein
MFNAAGTTLLNMAMRPTQNMTGADKAADLFMGSDECTQLQNRIKDDLYLAERLMLLEEYSDCIDDAKRKLFGDPSEGAAQRLFDERGSIHKPNAGVTSAAAAAPAAAAPDAPTTPPAAPTVARRIGRRGPVIMADYAYDDAPMTTPPAAAAPVAAKRIGRRGPVTGPVMANFAYQGSGREPNHLFRLAVARAKAHHRP